MAQDPTGGGYIIEFYHAGGSVKVTAIDPSTGREVSIVGAPSVSESELAGLAVRKLQYVLARDGEG